MQELYDDDDPGDHRASGRSTRARSPQRLSDVADGRRSSARRATATTSRRSPPSSAPAASTGSMIVMLTYGPAMRTVRALMETAGCPLLLANIQPERAVTAAWDMDDLTYNQGIHGAQDQANALVRADIPFSVITGEWRSERVRAGVRATGRAPRPGGDARCARSRDRAARLPDERHGRHPLRPAGDAAAARADGRRRGPRRARTRGCRRSPTPPSRRWSPSTSEPFEIDPALPRAAPRLRGAARGRAARRCSRTAATRASRSTSTRSAATAASSSCRCWPPRT